MEENNAKPYVVSKRLLLGIYAIVPAVLLLCAFDAFFLNFVIQQSLGINATTAVLYVLFLELPHIIASFVSYADAEYLRFYKKRLFIHLPILLLCVLGIIFVHVTVAFLLYIIYTMYHSIKQQTGIARLLIGTSGSLHTLWSSVGILTAVAGNIYIFSPELMSDAFALVINIPVLSLLVAAFTLCTLLYLRSLPRNNIGTYYVLATSCMLLCAYLCIVFNYLFFAVFIVRFVHDVTAFVFYTVHDSNRNFIHAPNFLYRILKPLHFPLVLITPILGIFVALYLQRYTTAPDIGMYVVILLGTIHYYIEGFMWKRESLHRKHLRFVE